MLGCTKTGTSGSSSAGNTPLLSQEIIVAKNGLNATVDSIVFDYQYDANRNLTGAQQTMSSNYTGDNFLSDLTYQFTYSSGVISGITGTFTQSAKIRTFQYSATTQISITFSVSAGKVLSYVQVAKTTGTPILPVTPITGNDSAVLTYDGNGNLATDIIYLKGPASPNYKLYSKESFTFSNNDLVGSVLIFALDGIPVDTTNSIYSYNSKLSASPLYGVPGVPLNSLNDLVQLMQSETGLNPSEHITNYSSTYNAKNQPVSSAVTITSAQSTPQDAASESISYTYQ